MENVTTFVPSVRNSFDFENNKVEIITLDELKRSADETFFGSARLNGIRHYDFIDLILLTAAKYGLKAHCDIIYAAQNKSKTSPWGASILPALEEKYGPKAIEAHLLRRILTKVIISDLENDESNTSMAISFHQEGLELAFGPNIKICSNQCIFGAERYMRTYGGAGKMPGYEKMIEVTGEWFANFTENRNRDLAIMEKMKAIQVTYRDMAEMVGQLSFMRVGRDDLGLKVENPLSQKQINQVSKQYLEAVQDRKKAGQEITMSLFDVYNLGTSTMKPENAEIPNILYQTNTFGEFILEKVR